MPPSWTLTCALARRRSEPARCKAAPVSGNSTKAAIEMRGTGRSCGAAPNSSSFSGALDFTMTSLCPSLLAHVGNGARLIRRQGRPGRLAVLVVVVDHRASRGIGRTHRLRRNQIARVGYLGSDVVLHGAAEICHDVVGRG